MPRKSMESSLIKYANLFEEEARYIVPRFQRNYNWKSDHVNEFWSDLIKHWDDREKRIDRTPYYFGNVMLVNENETDFTFRIVDGQQRMATSMIFFIVLRDYFLECENDDDVKDLEKIIYYEDENNQLKPRLQLNRYNNQYFEELLVKDKMSTKKSSVGKNIKAKNRALANCYKQIADKLQENFGDADPEKKVVQLRGLYEHLLNHFSIIQNIFATKQSAYRIFETINHKGLHLDENDLVKNYLMELIDDTNSVEESEDIIAADNKWGDIMSKLEDVRIKEDVFLRIHLTAFEGKTPKNYIYGKITKKITNKDSAQNFLNELEKSASFLYKIKKAESIVWDSDQEIIDNLDGLNVLTDGGMYPILLAANEKLKLGEMKKLIELVTKLHFRAKTVCALSYTSIEALVVKICKGIAENDYSVSDIRKQMLSWQQYPSDDEFSIKFNKLELSPNKAKYVLREIEYSKIGGRSMASTYITSDIQVEHIMPKSIDGDWHDELSKIKDLNTPAKIDDYHKRNLNRLGNLTLLSPGKNTIIQNDGYIKKLNGVKEKYSGYRDDRLEITADLKKYAQWNEEVMKAREADFYVHAQKIWDLNLCG